MRWSPPTKPSFKPTKKAIWHGQEVSGCRFHLDRHRWRLLFQRQRTSLWPETLRRASGGDVKIVEHKYGKVIWIQENAGNKYAAHFWVERPSGWKLLHNTETATRPASENPDGRSPYAIPCVNPCQEMPYKPVTANEKKAAIRGWMEQEDGIPEHWRMHIGDDQVVVGSYGVWRLPNGSLERHQQAQSQRSEGGGIAGAVRPRCRRPGAPLW